MNRTLQEHVTSASFNLTLSKGQIHQLKCFMHNDYDGAVADGRFMMHIQALQRRGLVIHHPPKHVRNRLSLSWENRNDRPCWEVTEAGKLVYKLLVEAGLIEVPVSKEETA